MSDLPEISDEALDRLAKTVADQVDRAVYDEVVYEGMPLLSRSIVDQMRTDYRAGVRDLLAALVASGWRPEGDDPRHVIEFREDGWTIKHPMSCRPKLFECPVNRAAEQDLTERPAALGRFECSVNDIGDRLYIGDRIEAAQRPDTEGGVER